MSDKQLTEYYQQYITQQMANDKIISVSGFKKFLMIDKRVDINSISDIESWSGIKGNLEILYESYLTEKAAQGGRNSQTFTALLNKLYERQARTGADTEVIRVKIDLANSGKNVI